MMKKLIATFCICVLTYYTSTAQVNVKRNPNPALQYLLINPDPVGGALGFSGVTQTNSYSAYYNVGSSAFNQVGNEFNVNFTKVGASLVDDMNMFSIGYQFNPTKEENDSEKSSRVNVGLTYFQHGLVELRSTTGIMTGTINPFDFNIRASYSRKLTEKFSVGAGFKYLNSRYYVGDLKDLNAAPVNVTTLGALNADIGMYYETDMAAQKKWHKQLGLSIHNIGAKLNYGDNAGRNFQPTLFRLGGHFERNVGTIDEEDDDSKIGINLEFSKLLVPTPQIGKDLEKITGIGAIFSSWGDAPNGLSEELSEIWTSFGVTYIHKKNLSFRAGIFYDPASKGDRTILTGGIGVQEIELPNRTYVGFDISYRTATGSFSPMTNTFQIGVHYRWNKGLEEMN